MNVNPTTIALVVVACLTLQAAESKEDLSLTTIFSKLAERAARSIQPRQSGCTAQQLQNIYAGYPSDCARNFQLADFTNFQGIASLYGTFCQSRCSQAIARFFFECGLQSYGELFIQLCGTNANNQRCYNLIGTLTTDAARVQSSCPTGGSSCPSSCRSSILTFRNNFGCCVNVFNHSAYMNLIAADDYRLWVSCSVETPGFCTQSTASRPGSVPATTSGPIPGANNGPIPGANNGPIPGTNNGPIPGANNGPIPGVNNGPIPGANNRPNSGATSTQYPLSKLLAGLLLGVVMAFML